MNRRGQNFPVKSPEEINTSRMPDGLGLVQYAVVFPCPRAGLVYRLHPIASRCLGCYGRKPFDLYHVTMIIYETALGLVKEPVMPRGMGCSQLTYSSCACEIK